MLALGLGKPGVRMPKVVVLGGGIAGLSTGMLLAGQGCQVTVLERDLAGVPDSPGAAWQDWADRISSVAAEHAEFLIPGPTRADLLSSLG
jgi:glycine/D-amino acid oxidase-like deaminating enzyme